MANRRTGKPGASRLAPTARGACFALAAFGLPLGWPGLDDFRENHPRIRLKVVDGWEGLGIQGRLHWQDEDDDHLARCHFSSHSRHDHVELQRCQGLAGE